MRSLLHRDSGGEPRRPRNRHGKAPNWPRGGWHPPAGFLKKVRVVAEPPFLSVEGEMAAEASAGGWVDGIMIFKFKTDLSGRPPNQSPLADLKFPFARRGRQARK